MYLLWGLKLAAGSGRAYCDGNADCKDMELKAFSCWLLSCFRRRARRLLNHTWTRASVSFVLWREKNGGQGNFVAFSESRQQLFYSFISLVIHQAAIGICFLSDNVLCNSMNQNPWEPEIAQVFEKFPFLLYTKVCYRVHSHGLRPEPDLLVHTLT